MCTFKKGKVTIENDYKCFVTTNLAFVFLNLITRIKEKMKKQSIKMPRISINDQSLTGETIYIYPC